MTAPPTYPEELLAQTTWLQRLTRELVPAEQSADLVQETLVAALERPKPDKAGVRTWLERIARNLAAGGTRARHRRLQREQHAIQSGAVPSTAETIAEFEMHRSVVDAVQSLRDPIRTTLLLRFWEDLSPREIAQRMQAPVETVRTRIKRGLHELRGALDAHHGRRDAWCVPLLFLFSGRRAVAAPTSLAVTTSVLIMNIKVLTIGAMVAVALVGAFAWSAANPGIPTPVSRSGASAPKARAVTQGEAVPTSGVKGEQVARVANQRRVVVGQVAEQGAWLFGTIADDLANPLADVEVCWLTEAEADMFRRPTGPKLLLPDVEIDRTRWTTWHFSDRGWMKQRALLGQIFETESVTRTDAEGAFRFRRDESEDRSVLAVWSPVIGCRFHTMTSSTGEQHIVCKTWPSIRGRITSNSGAFDRPIAVTVDYQPPRGGRAVQFEADASGNYQTPQIPPGLHEIGFRTAGYHAASERIDLRVAATVDATLTRFAQLRARLIDTDGRGWTRQRIAALGWQPAEMQFLLLREDFQNETDLSADPLPHSMMQFSPDDGWIRGAVADEQAMVFSIWSGPERIAAVRLPDHRVQEVAIDLPRPRPTATLAVHVVPGKPVSAPPMTQIALGTPWGMGRYNFREAAAANGAEERFALQVPRHLRGQTAQLVVRADGFSEQTLAVPIPLAGEPQAVHVSLPPAEFTLRGRVTDERNQPLAGARIKIATIDGQIFRSLGASFCVTDEAGAFAYSDLTDRQVRVFVSREGFASTSATTVSNRQGVLTVRLLPGVPREIDISKANGELVMFRVLDSRGEPLLDDRVYGAVHGGESTRMRLSIHAHKIEVWRVNGTEPAFTINAQ